ncbi:hypothetical protein DID88_005563 [Monilinia fructigena]|uniref:Uncharacterized protein n=1 Tax=Monilinia fructigena TaxID=38457 RepID=A0A395J0G7_9HELO|nr:hypothetical protein DID88_005563 [Monilinia fructigena]
MTKKRPTRKLALSTKHLLHQRKTKKKENKTKDGDTAMEDVVYKTDAEIDAEKAAAILDAKKELHALINPDLAKDDGANKSGLYELRGICHSSRF